MRFLILLFLSAGSLFASEIDETQCPQEILELLSLSEDQQNEKLYTRESIKWGDFSFTYLYPDPTMNALIAEWTEGKGIISQPDPIDPEHQYYNFSSHPQDIQRLWNECKIRGLLREFFLSMIENPRKFCIHDSLSPTTEFPPLGVSECACLNTGAYDRLINDRRSRFENEMIKTLKSQFQNRDQTIRLMSIGSGGLLQEAIFLGKLILEGFSSFDLTIVDIHGMGQNFGNLRRFFKENFPNIKITWQCADTIADIHHMRKFDLIYAIDFDELFSFYEKDKLKLHDWFDLEELIDYKQPFKIEDLRSGLSDIISAKTMLAPSGTIFVGFAQQDMKLSSSNELKLFHQSEYVQKQRAFQTVPLDRVNILTNVEHPNVAFAIFVTLLDQGCQSIHLTMEQRSGVSTKTIAWYIQQQFPQFSNKITIEIVDDIRPFIPGAHATFLDTNYIQSDLSDYEGAIHTMILNYEPTEAN